MSNWIKGKRISILGAGRSGIASAMLALQQGAIPFVSDIRDLDELAEVGAEFNNNWISYEFAGHTEKVLNADYIVLSPGIPDSIAIVKEAEKKNIPVISEIEFSSRFVTGSIIAITGSNGKSTTTSLIYELIKAQGHRVQIAGNIGTALAEVLRDENTWNDIFVIEVSSFQLEKIEEFHPQVAVILNMSPDHLDRYPDIEKYYEAKANILKNLVKDDTVVVNQNDDNVMRYVSDVESSLLSFSLAEGDADGFYKDDLIFALDQTFAVKDIALRGPHNWQNVMAAILATKAILPDMDYGKMKSVLSDFTGLAHRLEKVGQINKVSFYNDSKATTIESLQVALETFSRKIILIAGGKNKGGDFSKVNDLIKKNVSIVIALGKAGEEIVQTWSPIVPVWQTWDFPMAVEKAFLWADKLDTDVLLSPACASFDMFIDFEDRGNQFKDLVRKVIDEQEI